MSGIENLALDEEQLRACRCSGSAVVIAGPGAGKTRTLLGRVLFLLEEGVSQDEIILLTFTVKAAAELKERLKSLGLSVKVETFHGLAYRLCRERGLSPRIVSVTEKEAIFKKILREKGLPTRRALKMLEKLEVSDQENELFKAYEKVLEREALWDFRRLIVEATRRNPLSAEPLHLLIDEFQDLNYELLSFLRSFERASFYFVGDPAQSIYGFRGARPELIKEFLDDLSELQVFFLTRSYRVPENILSFAELLRDRTFDAPALKSVKRGGEFYRLSCPTPEIEAREVAKRIEKLMGGVQLEGSKKGFSPQEIAVVARLRRLLSPVKEALLERGIPVDEAQEEPISEIKGLLSEANSLAELKDKINKFDLGPEIQYLLEESKDLDDFKARLEFYTAFLSVRLKQKGVALLTIHETKGLEFEAVFLVGAEEGLLPLEFFEDTDPAEERRLAYVALTRAGQYFIASSAKRRNIFGRRLPGRVSPFFASWPVKIIKTRSAVKPRQKTLF